MADLVRVQILFTVQTPHGPFTDCIYKTPAEYAGTEAATIEVEKQARVDAFVARIENNVAPAEPTVEDLKADKENLERNLADINAKLVSHGEKLDEEVVVDDVEVKL